MIGERKMSDKYVTDLENAPADWVNKGFSTSHGAGLSGERMSVGLVHKARGTGSKPHRHKCEQFNFVLRGTLMGDIDGEPFRCPRGSVVHIPADTMHSIIADPDDENVIFFVCKDIAAALGEVTTADGQFTGPRLEEGFALDEELDRNRHLSK